MIAISISWTLSSENTFGNDKLNLAMHQGTMYFKFCMEEATLLSQKVAKGPAWTQTSTGPGFFLPTGAGSCRNNKSAIIESDVRIYSTYVNCSRIFVAGCPKFCH
jgi:hypothetical protein